MAKAITTKDVEISFELGRVFHGIGLTSLEISFSELEQAIGEVGYERIFLYLKNDIFPRMIDSRGIILVGE